MDPYKEDSDSSSSSLSIPEQNIDFTLYYATRTCSNTVPGQARVEKGDALELLDDSNAYWWQVKVLETKEYGYVPAENVETSFERLARLNMHLNTELQQVTEEEKNQDKEKSVGIFLHRKPNRTRRSLQLLGKGKAKMVRFSNNRRLHRFPPATWDTEDEMDGGNDDWDIRDYYEKDPIPEKRSEKGYLDWQEVSLARRDEARQCAKASFQTRHSSSVVTAPDLTTPSASTLQSPPQHRPFQVNFHGAIPRSVPTLAQLDIVFEARQHPRAQQRKRQTAVEEAKTKKRVKNTIQTTLPPATTGGVYATPPSPTRSLRRTGETKQSLHQEYLRSPASPTLQDTNNANENTPPTYATPTSHQRPGSLLYTTEIPGVHLPNSSMFPSVTELSVIRVFAGHGLEGDTDATFKTILLSSQTTTNDMLAQAVQRFGLPHDAYYLTIKQVEGGTSAKLRPGERPLSIFEALARTRNSITSFSSVSSDFVDDYTVKFYIHRGEKGRHDDEGYAADEEKERNPHSKRNMSAPKQVHTSSTMGIALQLGIYAADLPGDGEVALGLFALAIRKLLILPKNVTAAEVIELGLEVFGVPEGVVDGGDEVEDKLTNGESRVRYGLTMLKDAIEKELAPSTRVVDAYPQSLGAVSPDDPVFLLRRARTHTSMSVPLDDLALWQLHKNSSPQRAKDDDVPTSLTSYDAFESRSETPTTSMTSLSPGPKTTGRSPTSTSPLSHKDTTLRPGSVTPTQTQHLESSSSSYARPSPIPGYSATGRWTIKDDFGLSQMMAIIDYRANATKKANVDVSLPSSDPFGDMLFGKSLDLAELHPAIREIYRDLFWQLEGIDKYLDEQLLRIQASRHA